MTSQKEPGSSTPLDNLNAGETATLLELEPSIGITGRLASLGFTPGVVILMAQNFGHGPLVVTVRDTRVALGRQEAAKILVKRS